MRLSTRASAVAVLATALGVSLLAPGAAQAQNTVESSSGDRVHGMGFDAAAANAAHANAPQGIKVHGNPQAVHTLAAAPASYSLKQYAMAPGDQGQVGSCVAWATGYTGIGLLANEQGKTGQPFAPMFIYAQIAKGNDQGTWASVALPMERDQGIDTKAHYWQGSFDYTTQPDAAERANALQYRISGFTDLTNAADRKAAIMQAISSGLPVPIGFSVRESFRNLNTTNYVYNPKKSERKIGGHEVTIVGYDSYGVEIENSWGANWGNKGYFIMPWSVVTSRDVDEVHSIGRIIA
ncbi:C1 family peptidase [Longispora sp. K20-0274]|uniref:C1 family peptidase n=1 Tax=Longispora sp. K20-0274 TaxID=3088255 RepID=UPI0039998087